MLYFYTITKGNFIIITFLVFQAFFQFFVQLLQTEILVTKKAINFQSILFTYLTSHSGDKFAASLLLQQVNNFIANSCQSLPKQDNEKAASNTSHPSRNKDKISSEFSPLKYHRYTICRSFPSFPKTFLPVVFFGSRRARRNSRRLQTEAYFPLQASKFLHPSRGMNSAMQQ